MEAEQRLIAANAAVGMAYTDRFPRLVFSGVYGLETNVLSTLFKSPYGLIGGDLLSPIFAAGKKKAAYKAEQAAYQQAVYQYEKSVQDAFREVSDAIVAYNKAREAHQLKQRLEQSAKKYMELAQYQYINGVIRYLDVLDAQREYFDAQTGLSNAGSRRTDSPGTALQGLGRWLESRRRSPGKGTKILIDLRYARRGDEGCSSKREKKYLCTRQYLCFDFSWHTNITTIITILL